MTTEKGTRKTKKKGINNNSVGCTEKSAGQRDIWATPTRERERERAREGTMSRWEKNERMREKGKMSFSTVLRDYTIKESVSINKRKMARKNMPVSRDMRRTFESSCYYMQLGQSL